MLRAAFLCKRLSGHMLMRSKSWHNTGKQMSAGVGLIQHGSFLLTFVCTTPGLGVVHLSCSCAMLVAPLCKLVGGKNASKQRYKMLSEHIEP